MLRSYQSINDYLCAFYYNIFMSQVIGRTSLSLNQNFYLKIHIIYMREINRRQNLKQKNIQTEKHKMLQQHRDQTPKVNRNINSVDKIVTSLGIYSNKKLDDNNKQLHSTKSIQYQIKQKKMVENQNQEEIKYGQENKCARLPTHNQVCEKSIDEYMVEQFQISSNNLKTYKNLGSKKQTGSNLELDIISNNYSVHTNGRSTGNIQQKNNQIQDPKERQYQILINKNKSNIVYLQSQLKQILKLNLLIQCMEQQKQIKNNINKMELDLRKIKIQLNDRKKEGFKTKQNVKKLQQLRFMCNQQKIISNQLNIRQIQTQQLLNKHKIYVDSMSIVLNQKQRQKQRKKQYQIYREKQKQRQKINYLYYQGQLDPVNKSSIKEDSMQMIQSYHYGQITQVDSQSDAYSDKLKSNNMKRNGRQKSKQPTKNNIISSDRIATCVDRVNKQKIIKNSKVNLLKLTDNSDNASNLCNYTKDQQMSQISQIIQSYKGLKHINYTTNQDIVVDIKDKDQNSQNNLTYNNTINNSTPNANANTYIFPYMRRNQAQYKKLLHQRIKILKQSIKFIKQQNGKREQFIIQQKMCIKKNIQLFKLDTLKAQQENRKLNKLNFRKKLSSLSNSYQNGFRSNYNFRYKLLRSNDKSRGSIVTNSLKKNNKHGIHRYRLKRRTQSSQENDMQPSSKLLYWNSYKQYQISTDRTLSASSNKNLPTNKYILNKPSPRLSPKISEYRNSNIYTQRNVHIHALSYRNFNYMDKDEGGYSVDGQQTPIMPNKINNKVFASSLHDQYYN